MSAEVRRIKTRNLQTRVEAVASSSKEMAAFAPADFVAIDLSNSVEAAYSEQWGKVTRHPDGDWDWPQIRENNRRSIDSQMFAIKSGDRLSALMLVTVHENFVKVAFLEGDPRPDCPLKGFRATLALDIAARYGQGMGKREIRLEPVNQELRDLYITGYGFEEITPARGQPYLKRDL